MGSVVLVHVVEMTWTGEMNEVCMETMIDPVVFRGWLVARPEGSIVGKAMNACFCPLSQFLEAQSGCACSVGSYWFSVGEWAEFLPGWARRFVLEVDTAIFEINAPVSREVALVVLDAVVAHIAESGVC